MGDTIPKCLMITRMSIPAALKKIGIAIETVTEIGMNGTEIGTGRESVMDLLEVTGTILKTKT